MKLSNGLKKSYIGLGRTTETDRHGGSAPKKASSKNKESILSYSGMKDPTEYGIFSTEKIRSRHNVLSADSGDNRIYVSTINKNDIHRVITKANTIVKSPLPKKTRTVSDDLTQMNKKSILQTITKTTRLGGSGKIKKKTISKEGPLEIDQLKYKKDSNIPKNLNLALLLRKITEKELRSNRYYVSLDEEQYSKLLNIGALLFDLMLELESNGIISNHKIVEYYGIACDKKFIDSLMSDSSREGDSIRSEIELSFKLERFVLGTIYQYSNSRSQIVSKYRHMLSSTLIRINMNFVLIMTGIKCKLKNKRLTEVKSQVLEAIRSEVKMSRFTDMIKIGENNIEISRSLLLMYL